MTALRIAFTELRRITASRGARLVVIALALVPTIYAGLYLYANHDPYGRLRDVPAAIVIEDTGADNPVDGSRIEAGTAVADHLVDSHSFDWAKVDRSSAEQGVEDGTYDFALVIPRDFSASLTSSADSDPRQAQLRMLTNDANSYLSTTIADTVTGNVRDAIAEKVSQEATTSFLLGIAELRTGLEKGAIGAGDVADGIQQAQYGARRLSNGADRLATGATSLSDGAGRLEEGLATLQTSTADLPTQTRDLATGARKVADGNARIATLGDEAAAAVHLVNTQYDDRRADLVSAMQSMGLTSTQRARLLGIYDRVGGRIDSADSRAGRLSAQLDELSTGANAVADGTETLATAMPGLASGISTAHDGASTLATGSDSLARGAKKLGTGADQLGTGLGKLKTGATKLQTSLQDGADQIPTTTDATRQRIANTIADPVDVRSTSQASAGSYGAGLAPFFMSLAAWIGGYVLFLLVRPLSTRALAANQTPIRVALGGWFPPALVGLGQVTLMTLVVAFAIKIHPANLAATWVFLLLISATFVAIIHLLNALLGSAGQFLGLVLMVVQLVTAGGTFPWQTIPEPLHWAHHVLPMSYAVDGLRQLMYGGASTRIWADVLVLAIYLGATLALTGLVARRHRVWTPARVDPQVAL